MFTIPRHAGGQERAISTLPPRRGGAPTPVLSPARRSAAVRMGRGGPSRPPEAEWSSGVAAFRGGCYSQDIFKDPKKRHDHLSVFYNKDIILFYFYFVFFKVELSHDIY